MSQIVSENSIHEVFYNLEEDEQDILHYLIYECNGEGRMADLLFYEAAANTLLAKLKPTMFSAAEREFTILPECFEAFKKCFDEEVEAGEYQRPHFSRALIW